MCKYLLTLLALQLSLQSFAQQKDLLDIGKRALHLKPHPLEAHKTKTVFFSVLPPGSQPAAGGSLLVTATTAAFYTSDSGSTFLSTATFAPYVALHDRIGFALRSNLWLPHNEWVILGDTRFLYYPQYTWGLGGNPGHNTRLLIDYKYYRFYQSILKRIGRY